MKANLFPVVITGFFLVAIPAHGAPRCQELFLSASSVNSQSSVADWKSYLNETISTPQLKLSIFDELQDQVNNLPLQTKNAMLLEIGRLYPNAKKKNFDGEWVVEFYPKRVLDAWIRVLLPANQIIYKATESGKNPTEALQAYLDSVHQAVLTPEMRTLGYGQVTAKEIVEVARATSDTFEDLNEAWWGRFKNEKITFFGSFFKGLSKPGSDVDAAGTDFINHGTGFTMMFKSEVVDNASVHNKKIVGLKERMKSVLQKWGHGTLVATDHFSSDEDLTKQGSFSALEPFVIEVSWDRVLLRVFSDEIKTDPDHVNQEVYVPQKSSEKIRIRNEYLSPVINEYVLWQRKRNP